jgi:hypothetical protein
MGSLPPCLLRLGVGTQDTMNIFNDFVVWPSAEEAAKKMPPSWRRKAVVLFFESQHHHSDRRGQDLIKVL